MRHDVLLTAGATRDLERLHEYIRRTDSLAGANRVLDKLVAAAASLETLPNEAPIRENWQRSASTSTGRSTSNPTASSTG